MRYNSNVLIINTIISDNTASYVSRLQVFRGSIVTVINSTVSGNKGFRSGGVNVNQRGLSVVSSTVTNNSGAAGAGLRVILSSTVSLENTIISGNNAPFASEVLNYLGQSTILNNGFNLFGSAE